MGCGVPGSGPLTQTHSLEPRFSAAAPLCSRRSCPTRGPGKHVISPSDTSGRSLASRIWSHHYQYAMHTLSHASRSKAGPSSGASGWHVGGPPGFTAAAPPLGVRESPWEAGLHFPATNEHKRLFLCALVPRISSLVKCCLFKTFVFFC